MDVFDGILIGFVVGVLFERVGWRIWKKLNDKFDEWANIS